MTQDELYQRLKQETQVLQSDRLEHVFKEVDRADFVEEDYKVEAYEDYPLPIPEGQTISQPTVTFFMLEQLDPKPGDEVADVGAGSGYTTTLLAHLVGEEGRVVGFEARDSLVEFARENVTDYGLSEADIKKNSDEEMRDSGPFDKVLVSAACATIPQVLYDVVKDNGIIVLPIEESIVIAKREGESFTITKQVPGFMFVPYIEND